VDAGLDGEGDDFSGARRGRGARQRENRINARRITALRADLHRGGVQTRNGPDDPGGRRKHDLVSGGSELRPGERRKRHGEGRTLSYFGPDFDSAEVLFDQFLDDGHAEPGARFARRAWT